MGIKVNCSIISGVFLKSCCEVKKIENFVGKAEKQIGKGDRRERRKKRKRNSNS